MSNTTQGSAPPPTALPRPAFSPPVATAPPPTNSISTTASAPPPVTPSTPATPSAPPPVTSSTPATPSAPPPAVPSSPPPIIPETPPATPSNPSPPDTVTPSPPTPSSSGSGGGGPPPPSKNDPAKSNPLPPSGSNSDSGGGVSTSVVVGVVVGGAVLLLLLTLLCVCRRRKSRRRSSSSTNDPYYGGPPPPLPVKDNINGGRQALTMYQHNAPPPSDEAIRIPPPPAHASRPPQYPPPPTPPLPTTLSSSGASGSNYGSNYSLSDGPLGGLGAPSPGMSLGFSKSSFTFSELSRATDGFSSANLLGEGGFGYVHRGMLPNGKEVAVKRLKAGSGQGEREFHAEIEIISRVHHKHLVSLVGYCITRDQRLLVYEFVPNYTMEFHLHGKNRPTMDFATRLKIALGSAKGLAYLHEDCHPKIIHRDIKAANILLDYKFEAKVADFGLAKFSADDNTHVSTRVMGTFGYLAPEYAASGKLTEKSDVFSFGVMLLEFITGRRPVDKHNNFIEDDSIVDWARPLLTRAMEERIFDDIVDPQLQQNYNSNKMAQMVASAAACVRHSARRRPRMSQIVRALEGDVNLDDLNDGVAPGHSTQFGSSMGSSDYDTGMYKEKMKKFRKVAIASQEYPSSEYSQATSDYGLNPSSSEIQTGDMLMGKMKKRNG